MSLKIQSFGRVVNLDALVEYLAAVKKVDDRFIDLLLENKGNYSILIKTDEYCFAAVDRIKSYPIFYANIDGNWEIKSDPETFGNTASINSSSALEFSMAGYVFGNNTLYDDVYQLQAGELLFFRTGDSQPKIQRYYSYSPSPKSKENFSELIEEFSQTVDKVILETMRLLDGRPLWIPLSGGLDSRLLITKFVEHGYRQIFAFTYGVAGNHEMMQAKSVAKKLGVPMVCVNSNSNQARSLYNSKLGEAYTKIAAELSHIPSFMEFEAVLMLRQRNMIPDDAVIINGQTGDFISGGHVPTVLLSEGASLNDLINYIINKHCSLWENQKTEKNILYLKNRLLEQFNESTVPLSNLPSLYEFWEWQERQAKLVVPGQRLYDFFGLSWFLPLWHADIMDFWKKVPYEFKLEQKLYIAFLKNYNYKNLFSKLRRAVQPWVPKRRWIPLAGKIIGVVSGKSKKDAFYKRMDYYSTYHNQYALLGREYYLKHYSFIRNPVSLFVKKYLAELLQEENTNAT